MNKFFLTFSFYGNYEIILIVPPYTLHKELTELVPENVEIRIVAPPERRYSVWIGGSILSSLKTFQRLWIFRKEYQEQGPGVIKRAI